MSRHLYKYIDGKWVEVAGNFHVPAKVFVHSDEMPATLNHADGKMYDSKSNFRKATRAAGCYEVGNDNMNNRKEHIPQGIKEDIHKAINRLRYNN